MSDRQSKIAKMIEAKRKMKPVRANKPNLEAQKQFLDLATTLNNGTEEGIKASLFLFRLLPFCTVARY